MAQERILIIDDDPDIVEAMKVVLESKQYRIACAKSGAEGLKELGLHKPDLIILDVMLETIDTGFEVARVIKRDNNYKDIPILMLTAIKERFGLGFEQEASDEEWLPVDAYCEKPLKSAELILKVEKLLEKRRMPNH